MKYGMNNLMKADAADPQFSFMAEPDPLPGDDYVRNLVLENDLDTLATYTQALSDVADVQLTYARKLENDNIDYEKEALNLERDMNSALANIGGSLLSGKYSKSVLSPKREADILSSKGREHYMYKMEGIGDFFKMIWEKIKAFFAAIWKAISGSRSEFEPSSGQTADRLEKSKDAVVKHMKEVKQKSNNSINTHSGFKFLKVLDFDFSLMNDIDRGSIELCEHVYELLNNEENYLKFFNGELKDLFRGGNTPSATRAYNKLKAKPIKMDHLDKAHHAVMHTCIHPGLSDAVVDVVYITDNYKKDSNKKEIFKTSYMEMICSDKEEFGERTIDEIIKFLNEIGKVKRDEVITEAEQLIEKFKKKADTDFKKLEKDADETNTFSEERKKAFGYMSMEAEAMNVLVNMIRDRGRSVKEINSLKRSLDNVITKSERLEHNS